MAASAIGNNMSTSLRNHIEWYLVFGAYGSSATLSKHPVFDQIPEKARVDGYADASLLFYPSLGQCEPDLSGSRIARAGRRSNSL